MGKYAEKNLAVGENIILKAKKSIWQILFPILWTLLLVVVAVVVTLLKDNIVVEGNEALPIIITVVAWALAFCLGIVPFCVRLISFFTFNLAITNRRVIYKVGVLRLKYADIPLDKVDHVEIRVGLISSWFKNYNLQIVSVAGVTNNTNGKQKTALIGTFIFKGIDNAKAFKDAVTAAVEQRAIEARRHQALVIAKALQGGELSADIETPAEVVGQQAVYEQQAINFEQHEAEQPIAAEQQPAAVVAPVQEPNRSEQEQAEELLQDVGLSAEQAHAMAEEVAVQEQYVPSERLTTEEQTSEQPAETQQEEEEMTFSFTLPDID